MATRRVFLKSGGLALFSWGVGPGFLDRLAQATSPSRPKVLVSIFLRGAMDGLMAVPPLASLSDLERLRPRLAMSPAQSSDAPLIDLGVGFGLHPAFQPLARYWDDGRLGIVHAVGSPNPTRSHFAAQDLMENGTPWRRGTESGWLNRVAGHLAGNSHWSAVSITRDLPRSLYGDEPALAIADLSRFKLDLSAGQELETEARAHLQALYEQGAEGTLGEHGREMFEAMKLLSPKELIAYRRRHGARYPSSQLGQSLLQIAYLIKAGAGLRVACADSQGWDTHVAQGTEPTSGLDVLAASTTLEFVEKCREEGKCVLFSTHIMSEAERLCDRIAIIHDGTIRAAGTLEELREASGEHYLEDVFRKVVAGETSR